MLNRRSATVVVFRRVPVIILPLAETCHKTLESHLIFLRLRFFIGKINLFFKITLKFYYCENKIYIFGSFLTVTKYQFLLDLVPLDVVCFKNT